MLGHVLVAVGTCYIVAAANAADISAVSIPQPTTISGTPHIYSEIGGGLRPQLHNDGIDFQLGYLSETVTNWTGGNHQQVDNAGQFQLGISFDLQQILGVPGGLFQVTVTERNGRNLVSDANIGALQLVNEIYGHGDIFRLTQFFYDQKFDSGAMDFKIGRFPFSDDFDSFSCDFLNLTFCGSQPTQILSNYIFGWPTSQWEGRVKG